MLELDIFATSMTHIPTIQFKDGPVGSSPLLQFIMREFFFSKNKFTVLVRSSPTALDPPKNVVGIPPCIYCKKYPLGPQWGGLEMNLEEAQAYRSIAEPLHQIRLHPQPLDWGIIRIKVEGGFCTPFGKRTGGTLWW